MLGRFRVLTCERPSPIRPGGKAELLLSTLALQPGAAVSRNMLLEVVWPNAEVELSTQSLHSLVYSLHRLLGDAIGGAAPVVHENGDYQLNIKAGISVDVAEFANLAAHGDHLAATGDLDAAIAAYGQALALYRGDLWGGNRIQHVIERERLRTLCLGLLAQVADYAYARGDITGSLDATLRLLSMEPCREDAFRLAMRCYVHRNERAQALRLYRVCERVLRAEFDAEPEEATQALFDQVRLDPTSIRETPSGLRSAP